MIKTQYKINDILTRYDGLEVKAQFSNKEASEISDLFLLFFMYNIIQTYPKACAIEDPTCENCSS